MKKSIILALALAVPAMAGDAKNVTVTVVDVPAIVPAAPAPAFAVEVAGVYNIQQNDINAYFEGIDTYGVDITGVYNINENWSVNMRVGYAEGSRDYYYSSGLDRHHDEIEVNGLTVMPGVRYTAPIGGGFSCFAGVNAGYTRCELELSEVDGDYSIKGDDSGFAYSAELGVRYDITASMYVFGAAQVTGYMVEATDGGEEPVYVGARAGFGWQF